MVDGKAWALRSIQKEGEAVLRLGESMDWCAFHQAVDALLRCNKAVICASGASGIAAAKMAHNLCCMERPAVNLIPSEAIHGGMGVIGTGDVLLLISRGGRTAELFPILRGVETLACTRIVITENLTSPLAEQADIVLPLSAGNESDPLEMMATVSFSQTIALLDALLCAMMAKSGYSREQYARIHPGGAVGERLAEQFGGHRE